MHTITGVGKFFYNQKFALNGVAAKHVNNRQSMRNIVLLTMASMYFIIIKTKKSYGIDRH